MEDFQDAVTVHTGETPMLTGAEWREIHNLLEITYNGPYCGTHVAAKTHACVESTWDSIQQCRIGDL
jgi:hypothetical protein